MLIFSTSNSVKILTVFIIYNSRYKALSIDREKCYEGLGCIKLTSEWNHPRYRPVNLLPAQRHAVNTIFVHWILRGSSVSSEIIGTIPGNFTQMNRIVKLLIHDFTSNGYTGWIQHLSRILLLYSPSGLNVVSVDWAAGAEPPYVQAIANARLVALEIVRFLENLQVRSNLKIEDVHIVGHGVGAHIAGYVGKINRLERITALDPAGLYFENMPPNVRLYKNDANYIEVLHTNANGQGNKQLLGHVDFFANDGTKQPGCKDHTSSLKSIGRGDLKLGEILPGCSHKRSLKYYIETLINQSCMFLGIACKSYTDFLEGKCTTCGDNMENCLRLNSLKPPRSLNSMYGYYFVTSSSPPFCGEMLKVVMCIQSATPEQIYVNGYFNVTVPQPIGDVNFLINENRVLAALRANKQHTFLIFRATPPPLLLPIRLVYLKWQHRPLPCYWCSTPKVTSFMLQKMSDNLSDKPQWFCMRNISSTHVSFGRQFRRCEETTNI